MNQIQIPVARPRLPDAARIQGFFGEIDKNRVYSNYGPLLRQFQSLIARHFEVGADNIVVLANATLGLQLALQSVRLKSALCLMPSWTFVATAHAAISAGMEPYFVDVDEQTWAMCPRKTAQAVATLRGQVGAVMVVAPFGTPLDTDAWIGFQEETGIPVIFDCAAGFDTLKITEIPAVVSMHATKAMGIGEGAFVASTRTSLIQELAQRANFGFYGSPISELVGTNAKMSEYQAAVGLAAIEMWPQTRADYCGVAKEYRKSLTSNKITLQDDFGETWIASTCVVRIESESAEEAASRLLEAGIATRQWWQRGVHRHPAFQKFGHAELEATESLAKHTLGLPFFPDLTRESVELVCRILQQA